MTGKAAILLLAGAGLADLFFVGFYIIITLSEISPYKVSFAMSFYLSVGVFLLTASLLFLGFLYLARRKYRKGGLFTFFGSVIFLTVYLYYWLIFEPSILGWLDPFGFILVFPSLGAGVASMLFSGFLEKREKDV